MRICSRCGTEMKEDKYSISINGRSSKVLLVPKTKISQEAKHLLGIDKPLNIALCPKCGEVSIYVKKRPKHEDDGTIMIVETNETD